MKKLYSFKDHPEHQDRLGEWRDRWIRNAMSTEAMTEDDREICRKAVLGLYAAAKLPAPKHIVFVPSPFVLSFASGFAAAIWHGSKKGWPAATRAATEAATRAATRDATEAFCVSCGEMMTGHAGEQASTAEFQADLRARSGHLGRTLDRHNTIHARLWPEAGRAAA